jgi:hypothetical protein
MSLANLNLAAAANAGFRVVIKHPVERVPLTGADGGEVYIDMRGRDSEIVVAKTREQRNLLVEEASKKIPFSAAANDLREAEVLSVAALGWGNIPKAWLTPNGEDETPAEFTEGNALLLFTNPGVNWLHEQVVEAFDARGNVLKASKKA